MNKRGRGDSNPHNKAANTYHASTYLPHLPLGTESDSLTTLSLSDTLETSICSLSKSLCKYFSLDFHSYPAQSSSNSLLTRQQKTVENSK